MTDGLRERKKRATRQAISDTATELFMRKGFDNTPITEIADVVGVSGQTVLNYFPTKADLFFDEPHWYTEPAAAIRRHPQASPVHAVLDWYSADLKRRHGETHLDRFAIWLQTIAESETLRRRRLDDLASLTDTVSGAISDTTAHKQAWEPMLMAAIITSAIAAAESETARLAEILHGAELLDAARAAATEIFARIAPAMPSA
jgi:AcrR family transcriptional regulator